jgi:hypothetical protein
MSIQLALRFDEVPITCETRAAISFDFPLPGREAIGERTKGTRSVWGRLGRNLLVKASKALPFRPIPPHPHSAFLLGCNPEVRIMSLIQS